MAKKPQDAAAKAAEALASKETEEALAAKKAEEAKAGAVEPSQGGAGAQESGEQKPQPDPPTPPAAPAAKAKAKSSEERRSFRAVHNVTLAGVTHPSGSTIEITRDEHAALAEFHSVLGDWDDD